MEEISQKLREARKKRNMTIEQVGDATKIRPFVIQALEANNFSIMPSVYINSFLKTLCQYYKIEILTLSDDSKAKTKQVEVKSEKLKFDDFNDKSTLKTEKIISKDNPEKVVIFSNTNKMSEIDEFKNLFKKGNIKKSPKTSYFNYILYGSIGIALIIALYLSFFSSGTNTNKSEMNSSDTTIIKPDEKSIIDIFTKSDSIKLKIKAVDTAWARIQIDGLQIFEKLFKPQMEENFAAKEFFLIDQGNIGALKFYRNDVELPLFGTKGSLIKNVKITANDLITPNPFKPDTTKKVVPLKAKPRPKKETPQFKMIEESKINTPQNPFKKN